MKTMLCNQQREQFDERLDGRLSEPQREAFDRHVAVCPECARDWQAYATVWQTLAQAEAPSPSGGFVARTMRRLDEAPEPFLFRWRRPAWQWLLVGATTCVIALSGWMIWENAQRSRLANVYAQVHQSDLTEDEEVIAVLDSLKGEGTAL
jgi:anti-sigma factor RsiW